MTGDGGANGVHARDLHTPATSVIWSATEVGSRRFSPGPVRSGPAELADRFRRLRKRRIRGYIEVEIPDTDSPHLAIGFRGQYAVIRMTVATPLPRSFLLAGDGSVPDGAYVKVPVMDDLERFSGEVLLDVDRAWDLVQDFLRTGRPDDLGEWHASNLAEAGGPMEIADAESTS